MTKTDYDVIIIGSGLGGLVSAYMLSKNGYKVAVLEKHHQIGGCLQSFKRFGQKFDTGMHYIGSMEPDQILYKFFNYLDLLDNVPLKKLDTDCYDLISIQGEKYEFAMGFDNFIEKLSKKFPNNTADIRNYIKRIREIAQASPLFNLKEINTPVFIEADYIKTSINDFIASSTSNYKLQNVLAGNLPLYAGVKDKTPTYIHALINNFYIESAYRIVGGSDSISKSLANSIKKFGGEIITNCEVTAMHCNESKAVSVEISDGRIFTAKSFISNIHPQATIEKLNTNLIRKAYKERIRNLDNTISNFTVYIKFKQDKVPYMNYNYYNYDKYSVWDANDYDANTWSQSYLYMHQCHDINAVFAESAELIAYMRFADVKKWENTKVGRRGDDYKQFKLERAEILLNKLEESFPNIKSNIESYETSSPLTYRDYTATKDGSMYGIVRDKNFPTQTLISQRTKVPNLFMTGQNINSHGILGVTIGALITCAEFLGLNYIIKEIEKTNI